MSLISDDTIDLGIQSWKSSFKETEIKERLQIKKHMALQCTNCTNLSVSLRNYKQKCSKLLSIILNELDDVKQAMPSSKKYLEEFLEKIKIDVTDYMVGSVDNELTNKISKLAHENESLKVKISELQKKNQDLEDKYCTYLFENAFNLD